MSDTPETDEQLDLQKLTIPWQDVVAVEFARRLERERDEARRVIKLMTEDCLDCKSVAKRLMNE